MPLDLVKRHILTMGSIQDFIVSANALTGLMVMLIEPPRAVQSDNPSGFEKGVAVPLLLMGLLMSTVGGVVGYRTPSQVAGIVKSMEVDTQAGVQAEINRMAKVNRAWHLYLVMWGLFGVAGLLLRFATLSEFLRGMGVALVFIAGVGLLVDGFAERRTHPYVDALQASTRTSTTPR